MLCQKHPAGRLKCETLIDVNKMFGQQQQQQQHFLHNNNNFSTLSTSSFTLIDVRPLVSFNWKTHLKQQLPKNLKKWKKWNKIVSKKHIWGIGCLFDVVAIIFLARVERKSSAVKMTPSNTWTQKKFIFFKVWRNAKRLQSIYPLNPIHNNNNHVLSSNQSNVINFIS